jgi:hypothetical protein
MWLTPGVRRILAYREPVDLRKPFPGLVGLVKAVLAEDPLSAVCSFLSIAGAPSLNRSIEIAQASVSLPSG